MPLEYKPCPQLPDPRTDKWGVQFSDGTWLCRKPAPPYGTFQADDDSYERGPKQRAIFHPDVCEINLYAAKFGGDRVLLD